MSNWVLVVLLGLQAHFAASYLVPLDERSQREFGACCAGSGPGPTATSGRSAA